MRLRRALAWVLAGALVAPAAFGAGRSTKDQVDDIEADLSRLQQVVLELQETQAAIQKSIADLRAALALDSPDRRSPADLAARLDSVETDLRVLQENQNDAGHRMAVLSDKMDGLYRRQAQMAVAAPVVSPPAVDPAAGAQPAAPPPQVEEEQVGTRPGDAAPAGPAATPAQGNVPPAEKNTADAAADGPLVDPEELYDAARADYGRGSYDLAMSGFQEFLERFPKSELADNALYWIGECHYSAGRLEESIKAFDDVALRFPDADKAPDAGYKKGLALLELNRTAEGIIQLQHVKDTWPSTPAGRLARTKLQALGLL